MTNIIFLDVDGVLNDEGYINKCYEKHHTPMSMNFVPFNPRSLKNLREIYESILDNGNDPLIILSSSWRLSEIDRTIVEARLAEYGMRIFGVTPYINSNRGIEIINWLEKNNHLDSPFVILDDDKFDIINKLELISHFVNTTFKRGLVRHKALEAINILKNEGGLNETRHKLKQGVFIC